MTIDLNLNKRPDDTAETLAQRTAEAVTVLLPGVKHRINREVLLNALLSHIDGEDALDWLTSAVNERVRIGRSFNPDR